MVKKFQKKTKNQNIFKKMRLAHKKARVVSY